ncbi:hypothetical protein [Gilliamella sp. Pas-s25]|uniref:hypothetical protein n=1 Tax=Gilliamella sp. Pas-s25 TaxID=2687310 RepID=UPI00135DC30B|nr:hypothetical protein [Gilliamella sp. Pas-s25]MWP61198.1 hypothetical protein [Gilliamella sp. Pas-s25]
MNILFSTYTKFFDIEIENNKAVEIRKAIIHNFRKPFIKKDMQTHGPLWNQYMAPQGAMDIRHLDIDINIQGYILVDGKGKNMQLYLSSLKNFLSYLENRRDGLFPATYFVNKDFTFCLGENGERGTMKPIYVYKGIKI